ncbi:unnamed protein product [Closterium sp. NIES-53]
MVWKGFVLWNWGLLTTPKADSGLGVLDPEISLACLAARRIGCRLLEENGKKKEIMLTAAGLPLGEDTFLAHERLLKHWPGENERWKRTCETFMNSPIADIGKSCSREEVAQERIVFNRKLLLNGTNPVGGQKEAKGLWETRLGDLVTTPHGGVAEIIDIDMLERELRSRDSARLALKALDAAPQGWKTVITPETRGEGAVAVGRNSSVIGTGGDHAVATIFRSAVFTNGQLSSLKQLRESWAKPDVVLTKQAKWSGKWSGKIDWERVIRTRNSLAIPNRPQRRSRVRILVCALWASQCGGGVKGPLWLGFGHDRSSGGGSAGGSGGSSGGGGNGGSGVSGGSGSGGSRAGAAQRRDSGGGQRQHKQCRSETPSPQQLREWFSQRGASGGSVSCPYVIRTSDRAGQTCGKPHTQYRCFSRLDVAWRAEFGDKAERPCWTELLRSGVTIFDLDYDAILAAIYPLSVSAEGDCYLCVPPDPGIEAAALGASESALPGTAPAEALHTFKLELGASRCFFATAPPSLLSLHLYRSDWLAPPGAQFLPVPPLFSRVRRFCLAQCQVFTSPRSLRTWSRLYTLATEPPQVAASIQVSASGPVAPPCSCRLLSHQTLLWHHRLGHPSLLRLRGMHSRLLVSGLPRSLPPLTPSPAPLCLPCVEGRQRAAPHSSSFPPTTAPLQTLHMDVSASGSARTFLSCVCTLTNLLNLWPRVSLPETSPTLRWTGEVGDASVFRVWGSRAFVRDTSADKLSACAIPCVFLDFPLDAPCKQFYHPTSRRVFPSQDVTFDELIPFYHLFPYRSAPLPPLPLFLAPDPLHGDVHIEVAVDSGAARGAASGGAVSGGAASGGAVPARAEPGGAELAGAEPEGAESEGAGSGGAEPGGAEPGGAEPASAEPGGAEPKGAEPRGAESEGAESEGAEPRATASSGAARAGGSFVGATGAGGVGATSLGGARVPAGAGGTGGARSAGPGGARTRGTGAVVTSGVGGAGAGGAGAGDPSAGGAGVGGIGAGGAGAVGAGAGDPGAPAWALNLPARGRERGLPRPRPPPVPGTDVMALLPSSVPLRVPLPPHHESSLPGVLDLESDLARAASPNVSRLLAIVVTDPSFESTAASSLVTELVDFAAACRLDYATSLVAESEPDRPPSVGGECALGTNVLEDRQDDFECLAAAVPHLVAMLLAPERDLDAPDIPTPHSYAEAIMGPYSSQWVKRPPGSPLVFKARYVARGFSQQQGVDFFHTFSPTSKTTTLWVLLHVAAQRDYELHSLEFSTAFLQGSLHEEMWLRRPPGFTGTTLAALGFAPSTADPSLFLRTDTSLLLFYVLVYVNDLVFASAETEALALITRDRARHTITLTQSHMVHQVLQRFNFWYSSPLSTPLPTGHSLSAPPSDESVEPSGPYLELVGCLMYLMTCTRPDLAYPLSIQAHYVASGRHRQEHWEAAKRVLRYLCSTSGMGLVLGGRGPVVLTGHADASWVDDLATQRSSQGYTFSLGSGSVSWQSTRSSLVFSSSCEAEIYAGAMAAQELRWLTYLLTDLVEQPRSPPVLYIDNKAMIALCQEHRLEHMMKHIALRYFLARELQLHGQLRLAYVATQANTADIFTKALQSGDHQHFSSVLGLVLTWPHLLTA